jgi:hypothetical protein
MSARKNETLEEFRERNRLYISNRRRLLQSRKRMPWPDEGFMKGFDEVAGKFFGVLSTLNPALTNRMPASEEHPVKLRKTLKESMPSTKEEAKARFFSRGRLNG